MTADEFIKEYTPQPAEAFAEAGDVAFASGDKVIAAQAYADAIRIHNREMADFRAMTQADRLKVIEAGWPW